MIKVLITGGSGLIGTVLTKRLLEEDIPVVHLTRSRNSKAGVKTYEWDWSKETMDERALEGVTHIVHLAGAGIADKPWTMQRKRIIVKSRVLTARLLNRYLKASNAHRVEAFISASGVGYYGAVTQARTFTEEDAPYNDFIAKCCVQWEREADTFASFGRVVKMRTGVVVASNGGAVAKLAKTTRVGLGAYVGSGRQAMPWIHIDDAVKLYYQAIVSNSWEGAYNMVATQPITNAQFMEAMATALGKKIRLPNVPAWFMKTIFGEMADILLKGSAVSNKKVLDTGFTYRFDNIEAAMKDVL